jgi:bifunctional non-homologous end joining protein LigD
VAKALADLLDDTVIDGEIVALDQHGKPSFNLPQGFGNGAASIVLYAFDLLMFRGMDMRGWPLEERREQLRELVQLRRYSYAISWQTPSATQKRSNVPVSDLIQAVKQHQLEGIVAGVLGVNTVPASARAIG